MRRSPNLDAAKVRAVVQLIHRMAGDATWRRIEREVTDLLGHQYTRQALQAKAPIKAAYLERKRGAPDAGGKPLSARARAGLVVERRLRERIASLEATVDALNERIVAQLHIGDMNGIARKLIEADLPLLDRAGYGIRKNSARNRRRAGAARS